MTDLLRQGSDWLERMRTAHCSSPVEYRRPSMGPGQGGGLVLPVNATYGKTDVQVADESGLTIGSHIWDFLVLAADLGLEPKAGDIIVADGRRYEVLGIGGERCWRWSDPYRQTYRIHTKDIGDA